MQEWIGKIKAVGFDVDGTLYHAPNALEEFFRERLREVIFKRLARKLKVGLAEAEEIYFQKKAELRSNTLTMNYFGFDGEKFFQRAFDEFPLEKFLGRDEKLRQMLLSLMKRGLKLFIVSNGSGRQIRRKLKILGVEEEWFESFVACYDYGWLKPEPEPFLKAVKELGVKPEECLYVGDRCETDSVGAKNAGMRVVIIGRECVEADLKLESVYEVEKLFSVNR